jgi:hypothetical protein
MCQIVPLFSLVHLTELSAVHHTLQPSAMAASRYIIPRAAPHEYASIEGIRRRVCPFSVFPSVRVETSQSLVIDYKTIRTFNIFNSRIVSPYNTPFLIRHYSLRHKTPSSYLSFQPGLLHSTVLESFLGRLPTSCPEQL